MLGQAFKQGKRSIKQLIPKSIYLNNCSYEALYYKSIVNCEYGERKLIIHIAKLLWVTLTEKLSHPLT